MKPDALTRFLRIQPAEGEGLSEVQRAFNQKIQEVETLKSALASERAKQEAIRKAAVQHLIPAQERILTAQWLLAQQLDRAALSMGFSSRQQDEIGDCIHLLCNDILMLHPDDVLAKEMASRWQMQEPVQDEQEFCLPEEPAAAEVDWEKLSQDPDALQAYLDDLERAQEAERMQSGKTGKKSKQQSHSQAQPEVQTKSIREVFVGLVKKLHPDLEQNPFVRGQKEGLMKEVIVAYEQDDLLTLLQLEADWVFQENRLGDIPENRLKHLLELLQMQVADLQKEYTQLKESFEGSWLEDFLRMKKEPAIQSIKQQAQWMLEYAQELRVMATSFDGPEGKRYVQAFVKAYG